MKAVILQPSYIPWRGYFHQIQKADVFVFYDNVQYDREGWRNRNRVKTVNGVRWLTVPVISRHATSLGTPTMAVEINWADRWPQKHFRTLEQSYARAPFFGRYRHLLEEFFSRHDGYLADFTIHTTVELARVLGIDHTRFVRSSTLPTAGTATDRLIALLGHLGADHYITGPAARSYLEESKFAERGIALEYMTYSYPEYPQLHPPFDAQVSILDLLFMTGPDAGRFIWGD